MYEYFACICVYVVYACMVTGEFRRALDFLELEVKCLLDRHGVAARLEFVSLQEHLVFLTA